jgi:hypothetical protein
VHRKALKQDLRCAVEEIKAVVTDAKLKVDCPQFSPKDVSGVADFIEEHVIGRRLGTTTLFVNGSAISLNQFTQEIFANTLLGMASSLKGVKKIKTLEVSVRKR